MSDVNAKIGVQIDTSQALAELKGLQRQLALFHTSVSKGSASAAAQQRNMQQNLLNSINATGKFSAQMGNVRTSTESFTNALEKNKLSMREYFRYAGGSTKTFGRLFKSEFDTIGKVAQDRVKKLQNEKHEICSIIRSTINPFEKILEFEPDVVVHFAWDGGNNYENV